MEKENKSKAYPVNLHLPIKMAVRTMCVAAAAAAVNSSIVVVVMVEVVVVVVVVVVIVIRENIPLFLQTPVVNDNHNSLKNINLEKPALLTITTGGTRFRFSLPLPRISGRG